MSWRGRRVGVLHTVPALAAQFHELLQEQIDGLDIVHVVDPALLSDTVAAGEVTDAVRSGVARHLTALRDAGAEAVLVTCSSIGEAAEDAATTAAIPLTRVDAAMARTAVEDARSAGANRERAGRIAVLATLEATLGPTTRIVQRSALENAGESVDVTATVVAGAAAARSVGDQATHDALIAEALRVVDADVVVLAQASMAAAAGDDRRVLTSPRSGAAAFAESLVGLA